MDIYGKLTENPMSGPTLELLSYNFPVITVGSFLPPLLAPLSVNSDIIPKHDTQSSFVNVAFDGLN